jgi:hypothetical protein
VLPFPFVLFGKNLFEPVRLSRGDCLVREGGIMKDSALTRDSSNGPVRTAANSAPAIAESGSYFDQPQINRQSTDKLSRGPTGLKRRK